MCTACESQLEYLPPNPERFSEEIDRLISCFAYKDPISELIIAGKYSFIPGIFDYLGNLAVEYLRLNGIDLADAVLCPIPLSKARMRWRGFNQSQILCNVISKQMGIPAINAIARTRNTKTQKDLPAEARAKNVSAAFRATPINPFKPKKIILVDDVVTTGSTLKAAALTLKQAGFTKIWALTLAKD